MKNKNTHKCAYCGNLADADPDHVFARTLFRSPSSDPNKINHIKVPCCKKCQQKNITEEEAGVIFNISSDRGLGYKHIRGIERSKKKYESLFNGSHHIIIEDGVPQEKYAIKFDGSRRFKELISYMAMGLIYEYIVKSPIKTHYKYRITSFMTTDTEIDTARLLNIFNMYHCNNIIRDEGRYNNEIIYAIIHNDNKSKILVYFQIFNPLFFDSTTQKFCRYFAAAFDIEAFRLSRYLDRKKIKKEQKREHRAKKKIVNNGTP